jgi:hypothetical protein
MPTPEEIRGFLESPHLLYTLTPLAKSLEGALSELELAHPAHQWSTIKSHFRSAVERGDLLMERASARLHLSKGRRAAVQAEMGCVEISGKITSLSMPPNAIKMVLEDAEISVPSSGRMLLSRDERQRLLILAASRECFPQP